MKGRYRVTIGFTVTDSEGTDDGETVFTTAHGGPFTPGFATHLAAICNASTDFWPIHPAFALASALDELLRDYPPPERTVDSAAVGSLRRSLERFIDNEKGAKA